MTLVSQISTDAYRQSNLIPIGGAPTAAQLAEALRHLNRIVKSVFGNEAGEQLKAFPIGRNNIEAPSGYPWYNTIPGGDWFVETNRRLMLNLTETATVPLHPAPADGARMGVSDISETLASYDLVLDGNGRTIEDAPTLIVAESGVNREWFYRQDLGNWMRLSDLTDANTFPFPEEFDDLFITMLAMRINPSYGRAIDDQSVASMNRTKRQFQARYQNHQEVDVEPGLYRHSHMTADRQNYYGHSHGDDNSVFNKGYGF